MKTSFILFTLLILTSCSSFINKNRSYVLTAQDVLTTPGKTIQLSAFLVKDSTFLLFYDNVGEEVKFYNNDKYLGSAQTNDEGIATLFATPVSAVGIYDYKATSLRANNDALITVKIINKNSPIIITDIGMTISNVNIVDLLVKNYKKMLPIIGSPKVLNQLANSNFEIIYLTDRDKHLANTTKMWLKHNSFPRGPVFFWDALNKDVPFWSEDYKQDFMADLKLKFPNLLAGFGDKFGDIKAYRQNEMRAYHLFKDDLIIPRNQWVIKRELGGHIRATTWKAISEHLERFPLRR